MKAAAKRPLDQAANALVQKLFNFALDRQTRDTMALNAARDALGHAGLIAPRTLDRSGRPTPELAARQPHRLITRVQQPAVVTH